MSAPLRCPVAVNCGGCPLIGQSAEAQEESKLGAIRDACHQAGLELPDSGLAWQPHLGAGGYRNRVRVRIEDGRPTFFNPEKSPSCVVLVPQLLCMLKELSAWAERQPAHLAPFSHLELRAADDEGRPGLVLSFGNRPRRAAAAELTLQLLQRDFPRWLLWAEGVGEPPRQRWTNCYGSLETPLGSFLQVNHEVNELLVGHVVRIAGEREADSFLDLYCGSGNFSLPLMRCGLSGAGVEYSPEALSALWAQGRAEGLDVSSFGVGCAREAAQRMAEEGQVHDLVVVNPPRAGARQSVGAIASIARKAVLLSYCSETSFARDALTLSNSGWHWHWGAVLDMFAQTSHSETLGLFVPS